MLHSPAPFLFCVIFMGDTLSENCLVNPFLYEYNKKSVYSAREALAYKKVLLTILCAFVAKINNRNP